MDRSSLLTNTDRGVDAVTALAPTGKGDLERSHPRGGLKGTLPFTETVPIECPWERPWRRQEYQTMDR